MSIDAPFRIAFDNARDPYTARNALGITDISARAPIDAQYITAAVDATLTAERVLTDTATVTWDFATAGQAKANTAGAASSADFPAGAWTAWSPTLSASTGTITSTTITTARYTKAGKTITAYFDITITNKGTGAGFLQVSLPVALHASGGGSAIGVEIVLSSSAVVGRVHGASSTTVAFLQAYNGTTMVVTGARIIGTMVYEAA
jgi:hypothetical protein